MTHIIRVVVIRKPAETPPTFFQWLLGRAKKKNTNHVQAKIFNNNGVLFVPEELVEYIDQPIPDPVEDRQYDRMRSAVLKR